MTNEFFLEQYKQIWEQRRQHVGLYWKIPVVSAAILTLAIKTSGLKELNFWTILSFMGFSVGVIGLFLRHNFFVGAYGLLLQEMDQEQKPLNPVPQFGKELKERYYSKLRMSEKWGSHLDGIKLWIVIMLSAGLFIILWLVQLSSKPSFF